jgi:hypothetical protein
VRERNGRRKTREKEMKEGRRENRREFLPVLTNIEDFA